MDGKVTVDDLVAVLGDALRAQTYVHRDERNDGRELLVGGVVSVVALAEAVLAAGYAKVNE